MLDAIRWDADLIRRYDQAGPRYWSYPTALQFGSLGPFDLLHALRRSRHADRPLSLCHSARTRAITAAAKVVTEHRLEWLAKEIELTACHLGVIRWLSSCTLGGTPNFLGHGELRNLRLVVPIGL